MDAFAITEFRAVLRHDARRALRQLRAGPLEYLPLAVDAARGSEVSEVRPIANVLRRLIRTPGQRHLTRLVFDSIPLGLEPLAPVAIEAAELILKRVRPTCPEDRIARAELLSDLGERYCEVGDRRRALGAARRCVRTLAHLEASGFGDPVRHSMALQVLSKRLSEMGRHPEGIQAAEEAVARTRSMATDAASLRRYIAALDTLANRFGMAGEQLKALETATKAHALLEECVRRGAGTEEDLAHSFLNLATVLTRLERFAEVIEPGLEAWRRFQALAQKDWDRFERMYLAANDLVVGAQSRLGLTSTAGPQPGESLALLTRRVQENPKAHLYRYMVYLVRHSATLADDVASDESVQFAEQAAAAARRVGELHGDACAGDEGHVHLHLARLRSSRGELAAARVALREAESRFRAIRGRSTARAEGLREARELAAGLQ